MKDMWQLLKKYFGDGFVPGSAPFRYNIHLCDLKPLARKQKGVYYGVHIDEDAMPLFSALGDTCAPDCTCYEIQDIVRRIDGYMETATDHHPDDYEITSGKNDTDLEEMSLYVMRDTLSWWLHWSGGPLRKGEDYWKHLYIAFVTVPDDYQLPPRDVLTGKFRFLGHTWDECRAGLLSEGLRPDQVEFLEMCYWRELIVQYIEKVDPGLRPMLVSRTTLMTYFRVLTANTLGCNAILMATEGMMEGPLEHGPLEMASIAQCLSMDMAKEALGVLQGEKTEAVVGDRVQLKRELRWVYSRCVDYVGARDDSHIFRRYATAGLHYVPMMDRYLERTRGNKRFPITEKMGRILAAYIKELGDSEKASKGDEVTFASIDDRKAMAV
nr:uncharacterized protein CTRU02_08543 [Colletotrichum truncatum]KAF6789844.1 hypothetical protein CTRU02_08543 [Colletotrichum truncatum]